MIPNNSIGHLRNYFSNKGRIPRLITIRVLGEAGVMN